MIWGLADMLARGYVVVATDYPGLGVPGQIHPYLIGVSEGRAVLDSVRAARACPARARRIASRCGATAKADTQHSIPGARRELRAGAQARRRRRGRARHLSRRAVRCRQGDSTGKELTAMTIYSWSRLYNKPVSSLVEPPPCARSKRWRATDRVAAPIRGDRQGGEAARTDQVPESRSDQDRTLARHHADEHAGAGARRRAGVHRAGHGRHHGLTGDHQEFAKALCRQGTRVRFVSLPGVSHTFAAQDSVGRRSPG